MIVKIFARNPLSENEETQMEVKSFEAPGREEVQPHRVEVPLVDPRDDQQYTVILLDAEDSFDVIVNYPDGEREIVWNLLK